MFNNNMNNIHFNKNKQKIVQEVFESSSSNYDLMNDLMSLGSHRLWKTKMIENINFDKSMLLLMSRLVQGIYLNIY